MKTCEFCGNPVNNNLAQCPYCGQALAALKNKSKSVSKEVFILNIESGMPYVKDALIRFENGLNLAKNRNSGILKIIHGYGSSGTGGKIKIVLRQKLKILLTNNLIKSVIIGEIYSKSVNSAISKQRLVDTYPELSETLHSDKYNPGITFVEL